MSSPRGTTQMVTAFPSVPSRRTDAICTSSAFPILSSWSLVHCVIGGSPSNDSAAVIAGHAASQGDQPVSRRHQPPTIPIDAATLGCVAPVGHVLGLHARYRPDRRA